nr:arginase family protein [Agrobacterium sp. fls2-241-TYG-188a]
MKCKLLGAPLRIGAGHLGCEMGPSALRLAGLDTALEDLGHEVEDLGNPAPRHIYEIDHPNTAVHHLGEMVAWIETLSAAAYEHSDDALPIFLGGDHAISAGTVAGLAKRAAERGKPLFVLWLDAHTDFHSLETTVSGNLHGTPVAYYTGREGFAGYFPDLQNPIPPQNVCMVGIRSVDPAERDALRKSAITVHDMRAIDEHGVVSVIASPLTGAAMARMTDRGLQSPASCTTWSKASSKLGNSDVLICTTFSTLDVGAKTTQKRAFVPPISPSRTGKGNASE